MKHPLFILTGKSGSGKTTISNRLRDDFDWEESVSLTTRDPREGERNGIEYVFLEDDEFSQVELYESVVFNGNKYGTSKKEIDDKTARAPTILVADPLGVDHMREEFPGTVVAIQLIVDDSIRRRRMLGRGDPEDKVEERLSNDARYWDQSSQIQYDGYFRNNMDGPPRLLLLNIVELVGRLSQSYAK